MPRELGSGTLASGPIVPRLRDSFPVGCLLVVGCDREGPEKSRLLQQDVSADEVDVLAMSGGSTWGGRYRSARRRRKLRHPGER